jgi:rsbT co-antagonist protein RsbR
MATNMEKLATAIASKEKTILDEWMVQQLAAASMRRDLISEKDLKDESQRFLSHFTAALQKGGTERLNTAEWDEVKALLESISISRAKKGFSPSETCGFVFSLKQPLFTLVRQEFSKDAGALGDALWELNAIVDKLGLTTAEFYQKGREEIIMRQQQDMLELSTPVVQLWEGVLALPMIGTLDSSRTQVVMETLLQEIVDTGATIAIIDITGVPTVDTLVAQHLLKTVAAARLMGADCIISGIRPQIAQTIVHLGVDLNSVITKASLADAFQIALERLNKEIVSKVHRAA